VVFHDSDMENKRAMVLASSTMRL